MRTMVQWLDRRLRKRLGLFELSDDPDMIFRVRVVQSAAPLPVPRGEIAAGSRVLELHFWNENLASLNRPIADVTWGLEARRALKHSCLVLAEHLQSDARLAGVHAIHGRTVLFTSGDGSGAERVFQRLGFVSAAATNRLGRFGEFWENVHAWMIMWTFNPGTLRHRSLLKMRGTEFWADADDFVRRHGSPFTIRRIRCQPGIPSSN